MRPSRIAALLVLAAAPLASQQAAKLDVELHYATSGDAWVTTTKPAYIAVFDISRTGVSQLYPQFTEQAEMQAGVERQVNLHSPAPLPGASNSSLVALSTPTGGSTSIPRWPHTLLVVASSEPLRVGNAVSSNIAINHTLYQEHHFTDTETEQGIAALVDMVRPLDPGAEVALDRIEAISTSVNAGSSYASYDPNKVAIGYECVDGNSEYFAVVPNAGAYCTPVKTVPRPVPTPAVNASVVAANAPGTVDSARAAKNLKTPDARSINNPDDIRRFIEANVNRRAVDGQAPHFNAHPSPAAANDQGVKPLRASAAPVRPATTAPAPAPSQKATISAPPPVKPPQD
jgi:hypothetical protein